MYNYNTLCKEFLQYKKSLGYKYKTDAIIINEIKIYLISNKINIITKEVIEQYARLNNNLDSNTIARNMNVFREFCKYLKLQVIECYQIPNKIYCINRNKFIPYIFTHDEINKIYNNLYFINNNYHYSYYRKTIYPIIIKILYQTGMRVGEVLKLKLKDYDEELKLFYLKDTKNNQERLIVLPENLNKEIKAYCSKFFCNQSKEKLLFKTSVSSIENYFYKVLSLSGIERTENKPRLHDLRHNFVIHNFERATKEGKDINNILPVLQTYLGHQSLTSLSYYFKLTNNIINGINDLSESNLGYIIPNAWEKYDG